MGLLNISGATFGVDSNELQTALNNLNVQVVQKTIETMRGKLSELQNTVDEIWVGQSATQFKNNIAADQNAVAEGLNDAYETLKGSFYAIAKKIADEDAKLVKGRE